MTVLGVFGDKDASQKLVTAALNDLLEAHVTDRPDEEFRLFVGIRKLLPVYLAVINWASKNKIPVSIYMRGDPKVLRNTYPDLHAASWHRSDNYMMELVRSLDYVTNPKIYALLGEEPSTDVRRALARAIDNGVEVRDLAEAGLTYVGVADNPIRQGSTTMANSEMTLQQAGELADEGDEESIEALTEYAAQFELDPDEYPTWAELATVIDPLLMEAETESEPEPEKPARRSRSSATLTAEELEEKSVPELRNLAKQLGVEGWDKNRSAKLIEGIIEAQGGSGNGDEPATVTRIGRAESTDGSGDVLSALARAARAFADALEG